jgi:predicted GNAT family acetyltransferase
VERKVVDNPEKGRFEIHDGDEVAGFAEYHLHGNEIALLHTEVADRFEGQGLGGTLARHVLDDARERDRAVLPYCPFIRGWITRHPDYVDLVPEEYRARFGFDSQP